jgi:hypothetical protein
MITRKARVKDGTAAASHNGHHAAEKSRKTTMRHDERELEKFHGVLQDFNFGPTGSVEGFLLQSDGRTVQVNVTPDVGFAVVRGIGQNVEATVEPEKTKSRRSDHPVYRLVSLTSSDGKPLIFAEPGDMDVETCEGTVRRINYSRDGEADGVILDTGDLIHLTPAGMKNSGLKIGDQVRAEGPASLMPLGQKLIEATSINGTAVSKKAHRGVRRRST